MRPLSLDADANAVATGRWGGSPVIIVGTVEALVVLDPNGLELSRRAMPMEDVLLADLDGDTFPELVVCGPEGLFLIRGTGTALGEPKALSRDPCEAVARFEREQPFASLVSASGGAVTLWVPEGGSVVAHSWEGSYTGNVLLSGAGGAFALATRGASGIQEESSRGRSLYATSDAIRALAAGPDGWTWLTDTATPEILDLSRTRRPVGATARGLTVVDLAGQGEGLVVLHPEARAVGILDAAGERLVPVPVVPDLAAGADLDGDQCVELVLVGGRTGAVIQGHCSPSLDVPWVVTAPRIETVKPAVVEPLPDALVIDDVPATLTVQVGQSLDLRLVTPKGGARRWVSRGGPPGLLVTSDGHLTYSPQALHVGLWSISLRIREGAVSRWSGIDLQVVDDGAIVPGDAQVPEPDGVHPTERGAPEPQRSARSQGR